MSKPPLVVLGVITGAHGVRGAVKIKSFTSDLDGVCAYGPLCGMDGKQYRVKITGHSKNQIIATIDGITDRNQVDALKGVELCVSRDALPEPDDDEFYIEDLKGLEVRLEDGTVYGRVNAVQNYGAGDVVEVELATDESVILLPFTNEVFPDVYIEGGYLTHAPPEVVEAKDG